MQDTIMKLFFLSQRCVFSKICKYRRRSVKARSDVQYAVCKQHGYLRQCRSCKQGENMLEYKYTTRLFVASLFGRFDFGRVGDLKHLDTDCSGMPLERYLGFT